MKAEAAAEVAAATARAAAAASTAALDAASEGNPADAAGQKAQLERTIAELTAALSARQKDFEARIRCLQDGPTVLQDATQDSCLCLPPCCQQCLRAMPQALKALTSARQLQSQCHCAVQCTGAINVSMYSVHGMCWPCCCVLQ